MTDNKDNLKQNILDRIKHDDVHMKSHAHFALKTALYIAATIFVLAVGLFVVSFIFFTVQANALDTLYFFGTSGIGTLLKSLPWILILTAVVMVVVLELLGKHFAFVYRKPLVYSVIGVLIVLVIGGMLIAKTQLHDRAYELAQQRQLPIAAPLYNKFGNIKPDNVYVGEITDIQIGAYNRFMLKTLEGDEIQFVENIEKPIKRPRGYIYQIGDTVVVIAKGTYVSEPIAIGIRPLPDKRILRRHKHRDNKPPLEGRISDEIFRRPRL